MTIEPFVGTWLLVGSVSYRSELKFIDGKPDPMGVINWLNVRGDSPSAEIAPAEGLTLTITEKGFQEEKTGNPDITWFNDYGELSKVEPFSGKLSVYNKKVYLIADSAPQWAKSKLKKD